MVGNGILRKAILAFIIAVVVGVLVGGPQTFTPRASAQSPLTSVIVELRSDPVVVARARAAAAGRSFDAASHRALVIAEQQRFLQRLTAAGVPYTVSSVRAPNGPVTATIDLRFNYVFNGITLEVPQQIMPIIAAIEDVISVHPNEPVRLHLDRAVNYVRAPSLYGTPPRLSQSDTQNTNGYEGDGVIVAVIDTGVDWTHPAFGGDPTPPQFGASPAIALLGPNRKVIYYMNFTPGVLGDDFGHGTHVAADIAGYTNVAPGPDGIPMTADDVTIHGVAPQAKIMAYKTLTAAGTGLVASSIMAIEDAVSPRTITGQPKPVADIINMSLGSAGGPDSASSIAADNAALAGVTVIASAGNSGPGDQVAGVGTIGAPGAGRRVIAVGANNDPGLIPNDPVGDRVFDNGRPLDLADVLDPSSVNRGTPGAVDGTGKPNAAGQRTGIPANLGGGSPSIGNPMAQYYVFCGTVTSAADVPDSVAGRIAIARASGAFATVANSIAAKGASAAIIIRPDLAKVTVGHTIIPTWSMQETDARYLLDLLSSNDAAGVDPQKGELSEFPIRIRLGEFTPSMATFSSNGPVTGFGQVKPDVTGPGVAILSATVAAGGVGANGAFMFHPSRYISASGTSFSSPITAGVAALIKQKNPTWTPSMIRAALVNSATNLRNPDGSPVSDGAHTVNEQGGGLIDALAAANVKAMMGVGQPGPTGQPQGRTFGILAQASPGNPDFTPSHSFGEVPIANVIGAATLSQQVSIYDVAAGGGAGTYELDAVNVRGVDQNGFRVSFADADGNPITSVHVPAGGGASFVVKTEANGETITASPAQIQWYVTATRAGGQKLRMPFYYRAVQPVVATSAPTLNAANGAEVGGSPVVDINGSYSLSYAAGSPAPAKFRVEEQRGGGAFAPLTDTPAGQTSLSVIGRGNGLYSYRVAGLFTVQYGLLRGPYSATQTIEVNRRIESDVTSLIQTAIANPSLAGGSFEFDHTLKNVSADQTIMPPLRLTITSITSQSGTVRASNADNGGNGVESGAKYDYSNTLGPDRALTAGETSAARRFIFTNPAGELFEFSVTIKGHFPDPAFSASSAGGRKEGRKFSMRLRFVADPETGTVSLAGTE